MNEIIETKTLNEKGVSFTKDYNWYNAYNNIENRILNFYLIILIPVLAGIVS